MTAEEVHQRMLKLLEEMNQNLKIEVSTFKIISDFTESVNVLVDKAMEGDSKALAEARQQVRWMETNYHMTPYELRRNVPKVVTGNVPKTTEEWLAQLQPSSGFQKYKEIAITAAITAAVTESVTLLILHFI